MSRRLSFALAACLAALLPGAHVAAADVGVSVNIGQPGFYGRIDIGNFPRPPVLYAQPVVIAPAPVAIVQQPIYLRVPPGHAKNWGKHCSRYNACGQHTYFVQEDWYQTVYAPTRIVRPQVVHDHRAPRHYREDRRGYDHPRASERRHGGKGHGNGKGNGKGRDRH